MLNQRSKRRPSDIVTLGEVAKALGVSRSTAYIWARSGDFKAKFVGGRFEVQRTDLERLVEELRRQNTTAALETAP